MKVVGVSTGSSLYTGVIMTHNTVVLIVLLLLTSFQVLRCGQWTRSPDNKIANFFQGWF